MGQAATGSSGRRGGVGALKRRLSAPQYPNPPRPARGQTPCPSPYVAAECRFRLFAVRKCKSLLSAILPANFSQCVICRRRNDVNYR